jgi:hypothetical protein
MGMGIEDLQILAMLREQKYITNPRSVVEIGAQQLSNQLLANDALLNKVGALYDCLISHPLLRPCQHVGIAHGSLEILSSEAPWSRYLWDSLGFTYACIDIDDSPGSIPMDLNYDRVPEKMHGAFTLVTNYGTTEHVANQLNAFQVIHDLTATGGIMIHNVPSQGYLVHGLVNYNPKFFWMLARSNHYHWVYSNYTASAPYTMQNEIVDHISTFRPDFADRSKNYYTADAGICVVLQKKNDAPYVPPLDVPTGSVTSNIHLKKRYWTIFT